MLKISVDYSEDNALDNIVRNTLLQQCMSIMQNLGFNGENKLRSIPSKFSKVALNVRDTIILITLAKNAPVAYRDKMSPLDEHGKTPYFD